MRLADQDLETLWKSYSRACSAYDRLVCAAPGADPHGRHLDEMVDVLAAFAEELERRELLTQELGAMCVASPRPSL